jgi:hypothetical protein
MDWIIPLLIGIALTVILGSLLSIGSQSLYKPAPAPAPTPPSVTDTVVYPSTFTYPFMPYYFNHYPYRPYPRNHLIGPNGCLGGKCGGGLIGPNGCRGGKCGRRGRLN